MTDYQPRHRKHALTKTRPRLQRPGRHRGVYVDEPATVREFSIRDLMEATFVGNPFRGRA